MAAHSSFSSPYVVPPRGNEPSAPQLKRPHPFAALLSALLPGAGQLVTGRYVQGLVLLGLWGLWIAAFEVWRFPVSYWRWVLLLLSGVAITTASAFRALRAKSGGMRQVPTYLMTLLLLIAILSAAVWQYGAMRAAGFRFLYVGSGWMGMTISEGDRYVGDMRAYRHAPPQRGDMVLLPTRGEPGPLAIKRVIAIPGDTIYSRDGQVYLNGKALNEPYLDAPGVLIPSIENFAPLTVPPGEVFVMGDGRDGRIDPEAMWIGLVPDSQIEGKPLFIFDSVADREGNIRSDGADS
jgi:signal peptidase I